MPKQSFFNLPEDKRKLIFKLAIQEFSQHPYHLASISRIVRQARIAKGSFYQYFEDKKDLYRYLVESGLQEKRLLIEEMPIPATSSDIFGYLRWQLLLSVLFEWQNPRLSQILYRALIEEVPFPEMNEEFKGKGPIQYLKPLLQQGLLHGAVAPWVDLDLAAFLLEITFYQFGKYLLRHINISDVPNRYKAISENQEVQQLLNNMMEILEGGMKSDSSQRETYSSSYRELNNSQNKKG